MFSPLFLQPVDFAGAQFVGDNNLYGPRMAKGASFRGCGVLGNLLFTGLVLEQGPFDCIDVTVSEGSMLGIMPSDIRPEAQIQIVSTPTVAGTIEGEIYFWIRPRDSQQGAIKIQDLHFSGSARLRVSMGAGTVIDALKDLNDARWSQTLIRNSFVEPGARIDIDQELINAKIVEWSPLAVSPQARLSFNRVWLFWSDTRERVLMRAVPLPGRTVWH